MYQSQTQKSLKINVFVLSFIFFFFNPIFWFFFSLFFQFFFQQSVVRHVYNFLVFNLFWFLFFVFLLSSLSGQLNILCLLHFSVAYE